MAEKGARLRAPASEAASHRSPPAPLGVPAVSVPTDGDGTQPALRPRARSASASGPHAGSLASKWTLPRSSLGRVAGGSASNATSPRPLACGSPIPLAARASVMSIIDRLQRFSTTSPSGSPIVQRSRSRVDIPAEPEGVDSPPVAPDQQLTARKEAALIFLERMRDSVPNASGFSSPSRSPLSCSPAGASLHSSAREDVGAPFAVAEPASKGVGFHAPVASRRVSTPAINIGALAAGMSTLARASPSPRAGAGAGAGSSGGPGSLGAPGGRSHGSGKGGVWSEELEFVYQLLLSEEIHQVLATADAEWEGSETVNATLSSNKDVRQFIRANYGDAADDDDDDDALELAALALSAAGGGDGGVDGLPHADGTPPMDAVRMRLKGGRKSVFSKSAPRDHHTQLLLARVRASSPQLHVNEASADDDTDLPALLIDELGRATPGAGAKLEAWRQRVHAADESLSVLELWADVAEPLTFLLACVLAQHELTGTFGVGHARVAAFASALHGAHNGAHRFHNAQHAADVLYGTHMLIVQSGVVELFALERSHLLALLISAAVHDVRHPGVTNAFLVNSNDPLAITYNDRSVLESFHCAEAFRLMQHPARNLLHALDAKTYREVRSLVVRMVLATDMAEHFSHVTELVSTAPKQPQKLLVRRAARASAFARCGGQHARGMRPAACGQRADARHAPRARARARACALPVRRCRRRPARL